MLRLSGAVMVLLLMSAIISCYGLSSHFHKFKAIHTPLDNRQTDSIDPGDPLFLTPYIASKNIAEGNSILVYAYNSIFFYLSR